MAHQSSNPLDYEPHSNLSFNKTKADQCENLSQIRYEIDTIDHLIIKLMYIRMEYALATLKFKTDGKPIPDNKRIVQQLKQRRLWAKQYQLDPFFIESFFKFMIDYYMIEQIHFYQKQKDHQKDLRIEFASLIQLKSIEYDLQWIDFSSYNQLLSLAKKKSNQLNQSILVSFTQKINKFQDDPLNLFEHARSLSLSDAFLLSNISNKSFLLTFGAIQRFHLDQNRTTQSITKQWKEILANSINERQSSSSGPILVGGFAFNQQNSSQSEQWSHFPQVSFVLPQIQIHHHNDASTFLTFNTMIDPTEEINLEMLSIHSELISSLEYSNQLFNNIQIPSKTKFSSPVNQSDQWKQTVDNALEQMNNYQLKSLVLTRQIELPIDSNLSLRSFSTLPSSIYHYGILKESTCFFGQTSTELLQLQTNQIQIKINEDQYENWFKDQLKPFIENPSIVNSSDQKSLQGTIRENLTIFDLVQSLFPTPVVTGFPLSNALKYFEENEKIDQGWFTSPLGWIDTNGNGLFLLTDNSILIKNNFGRLLTKCRLLKEDNSDEIVNQSNFQIKTLLDS